MPINTEGRSLPLFNIERAVNEIYTRQQELKLLTSGEKGLKQLELDQMQNYYLLLCYHYNEKRYNRWRQKTIDYPILNYIQIYEFAKIFSGSNMMGHKDLVENLLQFYRDNETFGINEKGAIYWVSKPKDAFFGFLANVKSDSFGFIETKIYACTHDVSYFYK